MQKYLILARNIERMRHMKFIELAEKRYSVRKFSDKTVEKEKIDLMLMAGILAPTAANYQPQRILVINSKESWEKLNKCFPFQYNAPVAFLICYDNSESWKRKFDGKDEGDIDASIVTTHIMLQATELDIGTVWIGAFNPDVLRTEFSIPDNIVPVAILFAGYPAEDSEPTPMHYERKTIDEIVSYNNF